MLSSPDLSFSRTLPNNVFNQLGELLQQMAQAVGSAALVLTEAVLARIHLPGEWQKQRFTLVVSNGFSALLVGNLGEMERLGEGETGGGGEFTSLHFTHSALAPKHQALNASLTFDCKAIASFLLQLRDLFANDSYTYHHLEDYHQLLQPNDATLQGKFTLLLLEYLAPQQILQAETAAQPASYPACQPVSDALKKQIAQEKLLNQVTTQIRKSLDLPLIMATAVAQVREFLELDRLVIYKFEKSTRKAEGRGQEAEGILSSALERDQREQGSTRKAEGRGQEAEGILSSALERDQREQGSESPSLSGSKSGGVESPDDLFLLPSDEFKSQESLVNGQKSTVAPSLINSLQNWQQCIGCIVYEARATDAIPSVLNYKEENCFGSTSQYWDKYRQGFILAVDDVEKTYALEECLLSFLRETQVRAKLAAPIIFENKLWGLLIANQCSNPRHWTENEKNLLTSIAEQLAIAIHQSELMRSLTQEKQTLEQRVIERTMALRDALLAAEAASRLRSEFLATISHELLTPLTYVIGMSSTLLRWPLGELNPRQRDYLQTIHDSGEHLLEMINDILDLSQIEAGKAALNITEFSLIEIAESTVASLQEKATGEQVNLKLDLQIDPRRDRFTADSGRVEQILWNLLTNAIKFTPKGGSVTLRLWVEDDNAIFQVEDTGIGISEEQLPLLFEKFQQLDTPYRRRYEGTGLGLALTKQLVELHRGRIEVESTVGIGSIFTVWIPIQPMEAQS
ncbi:MAG: ATP-binding protein [Heteroscytonema crispum UTEX LB 1556]